MNTSLRPIVLAATIAALLAACGQNKPSAEAPRAVRTAELRYDVAGETNRYFGAVHARCLDILLRSVGRDHVEAQSRHGLGEQSPAAADVEQP